MVPVGTRSPDALLRDPALHVSKLRLAVLPTRKGQTNKLIGPLGPFGRVFNNS